MNNIPPEQETFFSCRYEPIRRIVRPGFSVPLPFLFLWLAVSSAPRTHRDSRSSRFQKMYQFPASLSGLTGPMVMNHSCGSSWQGRMRRRTIEPALSSEQDTTLEHRISFSSRERCRSRTICSYHACAVALNPAPVCPRGRISWSCGERLPIRCRGY